ncbi:MAG: polymer-forming cytoskeletal protein [Candidatus Sumerlaeia bacterium]
MAKSNSSSSLLTENQPGRRAVSDEAAARPQAPASGNETFISGDTLVEGKIKTKCELRIDGGFNGEIYSSSRVIVGTNGRLEATVEANSMVVSGKVIGNLHIKERLEMLATGELYGDLETQPGALIIEKGARVEGRCTMGLNPDKKSKQADEAEEDSSNK